MDNLSELFTCYVVFFSAKPQLWHYNNMYESEYLPKY